MVSPAFIFHVMDVIPLCPEEQMRRVHAKAVVAAVADAKRAGMFAIEEKPCCSMSEPWFPHKSENSITPVDPLSASPVPASSSMVFLYPGKKGRLRSWNGEMLIFTPTHAIL